MGIDRRRRITFEEVADIYDEVSLAYPEALVEEVVALSRIPAEGRILEIGCGPGNATVAFARRGYEILGIELGERLAGLAREHCRAFPRVTIVNSAFEDWEVEANAFDLAIAADAFHWIPPEIGYPKVADALKSSGSAAFFWSVPVDPETDWSRAIDAVYRERAPQLTNPSKRFDVDWLTGIIKGNFEACGRFGEVAVRRYSWNQWDSGEQMIKRLRTFSDHRGADEAVRAALYAGILEVIERFGGGVEQPLAMVLFQAQLKPGE